MQTLTLKAPAKLNLYLHVLNKRPDGFHNIETLFEKIALCDEISLTRRKKGIKVVCADKDVPRNSRNLCFQAAQALFAATGRGGGVTIKIDKKIPVAAGLGGGSSDAASTLLGLNKLFAFELSGKKLRQIAENLGADVPFFLLKASRAIGRGKGEILAPLRIRKKNWYILVIPRLKVSTPRMYQDPRLALTKRADNVNIILCALEKGDLTYLNRYSYNSFEPILSKKYKEIEEIKKALRASGAQTTLMSGSGPCIFGLTKTRKEAIEIRDWLKERQKNWQVIVTTTL